MEKNNPALIYLAVNTYTGYDFGHNLFTAGELNWHIKNVMQYNRAFPENHCMQSGYGNSVALLNESQYIFLQNLVRIIDENLDCPLSIQFLAKKMAVSKSTLNRKLSNSIGLSANELIRQYRLKKAASYLISGKNVSEAAYLTGFETASYFTQCFKELYNVTPKVYSRTIQQLITAHSVPGNIAV